MMKFIRKHQKKLLIVISVMVIASFSFFGTFSTLMNREVTDRKIGKAIDGTPIMERELHAMIRFLSLGSNQVLKDDLMSNKIVAMLAENYFDSIKDDFAEKLERAKKYVPYEHPEAPFISAKQVWHHFVPKLTEHLKSVKHGDLSPKTFAVYCDLYLDQVSLPPEMLARILDYQQQQQSWIKRDTSFYDLRRLALFGYQSFEEWFGPRFIEILGKFIFNAAAIAEEKGYKVSIDEARADLLQICLTKLQHDAARQEVTYADASEFLRSQIGQSGIDETSAAKIWKKVVLVQRLFHDIGHSVLVDTLSYKQFASYADDAVTVDTYQLPASLRLNDFHTLLQFEYYLDAVAPKTKLGQLPSKFLKIEDIEEKNPEFIVSRYVLEVAKVTKDEVGNRCTLKETWDFEVSDEGWNKLIHEFPTLGNAKADTREDRFKALDEQDNKIRLKIDKLARGYLVDKNPHWIEEDLLKIKGEKQTVHLRSKGAVAPFEEMEDTKALREFLQNANVGEAAPIFSQGSTYYRITVFEKPQSKEILTFNEAQEDQNLSKLLDQKLQKGYEEIRKKDPVLFKVANGSWKPFAEVRDLIGSMVYTDHLKQISSEHLSLDQYAVQRLVSFMEAAKQSIQSGETTFLEKTGDPLVDQWKLSKETQEIKRRDRSIFSKEELFTAKEDDWSSIAKPSSGNLAFFHLLKKENRGDSVMDKMVEGQRCLGMDASRLLMHQILERMKD